jgi:hypothetical protein
MEERPKLDVPARLLVAVGQALYGELWQSPLSRLLGHSSPRTVQRWAEAAERDATYQTPRSMLEELLGHLERKQATVERAFDALRGFVDQA